MKLVDEERVIPSGVLEALVGARLGRERKLADDESPQKTANSYILPYVKVVFRSESLTRNLGNVMRERGGGLGA